MIRVQIDHVDCEILNCINCHLHCKFLVRYRYMHMKWVSLCYSVRSDDSTVGVFGGGQCKCLPLLVRSACRTYACTCTTTRTVCRREPSSEIIVSD